MGILAGASSCLLIRPRAISKLSQLEIDADKDWNGKGIFNLKELYMEMSKGDIVYHDGIRLVKLSPGTIGHELTSCVPYGIAWRPPPGG